MQKRSGNCHQSTMYVSIYRKGNKSEKAFTGGQKHGREKRERIEITPEELEQVTGGSFNWKAYMEELAAGKMRMCPKCHKLMYYNFAVFMGVKYWRCLACDYRNPPSSPA